MTQKLRILFEGHPVGWLEQDDRKALALRYDATLLALLPRVKECIDRRAPSLREVPSFVPRGRRQRHE